MSQTSEILALNLTRQYSHVFSNERKTCGEAHAPKVPFAAIVLDRFGTGWYCNAEAAQLFRAGLHTLVGRHVKDLIPDLPFNSSTPGYNIAYATFWANVPPRRFRGLDSQGNSFGLEVALHRPDLEHHYQIIVVLAPFGCLPKQFRSDQEAHGDVMIEQEM